MPMKRWCWRTVTRNKWQVTGEEGGEAVLVIESGINEWGVQGEKNEEKIDTDNEG